MLPYIIVDLWPTEPRYFLLGFQKSCVMLCCVVVVVGRGRGGGGGGGGGRGCGRGHGGPFSCRKPAWQEIADCCSICRWHLPTGSFQDKVPSNRMFLKQDNSTQSF